MGAGVLERDMSLNGHSKSRNSESLVEESRDCGGKAQCHGSLILIRI